MAVSPKILYLEADEEVTSVVDKLRKTEFKKVVLVIPKEASLLQSVINLKLLKRQADNLEKSIAVVTHDKVGRALAEKIGILASSKLEDVVNETEFVPVPLEKIEEEDVETAEKEAKGPLADTSEVVFKSEKLKDKKLVEEEPDELVVKEEGPKEEEKWDKKEIEPADDNLMPTLPKKKIAIAASSVFLVLLALAYVYIPRAKADILVKAERKPVTINFTGEKDAKIDTEKAVIPIQVVGAEKEMSKKFPATGKKDVGDKAKGMLWVSTPPGQDLDWVTGTRFSPEGNLSLVYRATSPIHVTGGTPVTVPVEAAEPGEKYNGFGSNQKFVLTGGGFANALIVCQSGMNGGSTREVSYVTQGDVNSAKDSLVKDAQGEALTDFNKKVAEIKVIDDTKKEETLSSSASPNINAEGSEFTMTVKVRVKALGYSLNDVGSLIKSEVERQLGFSKQVVDDGADEATVTVEDSSLEKGTISGSIKTDAYASEKLDLEQIKTELVGLNQAKAENYLKGLDGVSETRLQFFPNFIKSFPRIKNHIFVTIQVADRESL